MTMTVSTLGILRAGAFAAALTMAMACNRPPQKFDTPEAAVGSLVAAAEKFDVRALKKILGTRGASLVTSPDTVSDRVDATTFAELARAKQRLDYDSSRTTVVVSVGDLDWPMPIPVVKHDDNKWAFDPELGMEEILLRRIGRNELDAIQICRGYVEAQKEYALEKHDSALVNQYAQRAISTPGKHDGLAWQAPDGSWQGPAGEAIARVLEEGYTRDPKPYHGYHFKILRGQGPAAPMGEMDFMVEGAMIGGFALVAAPAEYLVTGVKTFIVSHDGIVYEKDLGAKTLDQFKAMERYNPDSTWKPVNNNY